MRARVLVFYCAVDIPKENVIYSNKYQEYRLIRNIMSKSKKTSFFEQLIERFAQNKFPFGGCIQNVVPFWLGAMIYSRLACGPMPCFEKWLHELERLWLWLRALLRCLSLAGWLAAQDWLLLISSVRSSIVGRVLRHVLADGCLKLKALKIKSSEKQGQRGKMD